MSYLVTARKWRPQRFDEVVGQEHITTTLKNALRTNRLAHAYIFTGSRGVGKTTTARILAKAINCISPVDFEPCNNCVICKSINDFQSLDIIEIDAASNRGIDDIRNLRESVKYPPTVGKYKVYIIDEVHMLTTESFNALLKTLEEPPSHTIFIFATTDIHKVPLTIISRCQRFDFKRISLNIIKEQLKKIADAENIKINDKALTIIAKKSDGAMRDAQSFFDQVIAFCGNKVDDETVSQILNIIDQEIFFKVSDAIVNKNFQTVFDVVESIHNSGWDFTDFIDGLIEHFRNILSVLITEKTDLVETAEIYLSRYNEYIKYFNQSDILRILNFLIKHQSELKFANNKKIKVEIILSHLIGFQNSVTISELIKELKLNSDTDSDKKKALTNKSFSYDEKKQSNVEQSKQTIKSNNGIYFDSQKNQNPLIEKFLNEVLEEKSLVLGSLFKSLSSIELVNNSLIIKVKSLEEKDLIELNIDYLEKKLFSIFNKKIRIEIKLENKNSFSNNPHTNVQDIDDPIEKFIIQQLGGELINI